MLKVRNCDQLISNFDWSKLDFFCYPCDLIWGNLPRKYAPVKQKQVNTIWRFYICKRGYLTVHPAFTCSKSNMDTQLFEFAISYQADRRKTVELVRCTNRIIYKNNYSIFY